MSLVGVPGDQRPRRRSRIDSAVFGLARPDGGPDLRAIARFVLTRPWRLPKLARLGRDMQIATRVAASAAVAALAKL